MADFQDKDIFSIHGGSCPQDTLPGEAVGRLTLTQEDEIRRGWPPTMSAREKCYAIWDIVYPDAPKPDFPHVSMDEINKPTQFLTSICDRESYALMEELGKSGFHLTAFNGDDEKAIRAAMSRALNIFLRKFLSELENPITKSLISNFDSKGLTLAGISSTDSCTGVYSLEDDSSDKLFAQSLNEEDALLPVYTNN
ncbi:hypothetical protein GQ53DRAFT_839677 [Thozetella sp. PMI_491]|nr:hypothetical protein GQ53DRAFT_839677 [Thozetella sp. PMI_491]